MGKATLDLRHEHDTILHVLEILDRMILDKVKPAGDKLKTGGEVVYFLRIFADKCHHGKEENILFRELIKSGMPEKDGPIQVMLSEHVQGRELIAAMSAALEGGDLPAYQQAAAAYAALLRSHIQKENQVLFVMADKILAEAAQEILFDRFQQHEETVIGHGVHEQLHGMIHNWAAAYPQNAAQEN